MSEIEDLFQKNKNAIGHSIAAGFITVVSGDLVRLSAITSIEYYFDGDDNHVKLCLCIGERRYELCSFCSEDYIQVRDITSFMWWFVETYLVAT